MYNKPSKQLVWDLINASNPQLKVPLSDDNCIFNGYPVAVTPSAATGMRNTRIGLYAKEGKGYAGPVTIFYDRLNLAYLFNGLDAAVVNYGASSSITTQIAPFNALWGTQFTLRYSGATVPPWSMDVSYYDLTYTTTNTPPTGWASSWTLSAAPESLCWLGTFALLWKAGNPDFGSLITKPNLLNTRVIPKLDTGKVNSTLLTYGFDFTQEMPNITPVLQQTGTPSQTQWNQLCAAMQRITGIPFEYNSVAAQAGPYNLYGFNRVPPTSIPYNSYPVFNNDNFNRAAFLYAADVNNPTFTKLGKSQIYANRGSDNNIIMLPIHFNA